MQDQAAEEDIQKEAAELAAAQSHDPANGISDDSKVTTGTPTGAEEDHGAA